MGHSFCNRRKKAPFKKPIAITIYLNEFKGGNLLTSIDLT